VNYKNQTLIIKNKQLLHLESSLVQTELSYKFDYIFDSNENELEIYDFIVKFFKENNRFGTLNFLFLGSNKQKKLSILIGNDKNEGIIR